MEIERPVRVHDYGYGDEVPQPPYAVLDPLGREVCACVNPDQAHEIAKALNALPLLEQMREALGVHVLNCACRGVGYTEFECDDGHEHRVECRRCVKARAALAEYDKVMGGE